MFFLGISKRRNRKSSLFQCLSSHFFHSSFLLSRNGSNLYFQISSATWPFLWRKCDKRSPRRSWNSSWNCLKVCNVYWSLHFIWNSIFSLFNSLCSSLFPPKFPHFSTFFSLVSPFSPLVSLGPGIFSLDSDPHLGFSSPFKPQTSFSRAVSVGAVSYETVVGPTLKRDLLFCYDLELPPDFVPRAMGKKITGKVFFFCY